ncbi:MAG: MarR family transcriptional regulator [Castellaniella sp.]|uniref:MarR family winged helix-turn-helix transcriptional regulator n=1 Tax=Castellaniella sp. TaxID=1955812 RepID=UPI00120EB600|nr:MarR family transcriptional regulator [Castellaniella sp.]TAN27681.1 MAG: MarR family transcriptional regulator [Castellaniella sp.]
MPDSQPFYSSDPGDLGTDQNVGLLIRQLHTLIHQVINLKTCPLGLTSHQWRPLLLIRHKGIDTPAGLARSLCIDAGAVTRALDRLEAKGFVQRERDSDDRRVVKIVLTEAGLAATSQILPIIADTLNLYLQGFSDDEFRMLVSLLRRMIANGEHHLQNYAKEQ